MNGRWILAASAAFCLICASTVFGQASFGPIQPFAGAPSPVYVSAPYAGPELGVTAPLPGAFGVAPPQIQFPGATVAPPQIQLPAATMAPSLVGAPAPTAVPYQPINMQPAYGPRGCGSAPHFRLPLPGNFGYNQPNTTYMVPPQPGNYYQGYPQQ
jgi:hypothetical protein